jgi:hypothetical protein
MADLATAIQARLEKWGLLDEPEAAAALDLAQRLDEEDLRPAAAAMLHAQLGARVSDLRKLAPIEAIDDEIDELAAQREQRRKAAGL